VSLEDAFWKALREIAYHRHISLPHLIESINTNRKQGKPIVGHSPVCA